MKTRRPARPFLAAALTCLVFPVQALTIDIDYTYDTNSFFSGNSTATSLVEAAADYFESLITDDLAVIDSNADEGGPNNMTVEFSNPSTGTTETISNYDVPADTIVVYVGARNLGGSTLGEGGPGGYGVQGTTDFVDTVVTRGETSPTTGTSATDFAPWGGSIAFDSDASWYYDDDPTTTESFSGYDFYSVALHEFGHVLGIGTSDSWNNQIDNGTFTGTNATAAYGGNVPLANSGHWAEGTNSTVNGQTQEAAMDPTISNGQRKEFTELDVAGLEDVGWEASGAVGSIQ